MQENLQNEEFNTYVARSLESRVKPIDVLLLPIYDCYAGDENFYICNVRINSVIAGTLDPDNYIYSGADSDILFEFTMRCIEKAVDTARKLQAMEKKTECLFVRAYNEIIHNDSLYDELKSINRDELDVNISLLFDAEIMENDKDVLVSKFADIKAAGFKVSVLGFGGENFPIEKLITVSPNYLFTHEKLAKLSLDREKRGALPPLINLAKGLSCEVIACGISSDEQLREFRSRECAGFIPHESYKGTLDVKKELIKIDDIIKGGEK